MSAAPSDPYRYLSGQNQLPDLGDLNALISQQESNRQQAYEFSSQIKSMLVQTRAAFERDHSSQDDEQNLENLVHQVLLPSTTSDTKKLRLTNLSFAFGDYVRHRAYSYFLQTGTLIPQDALPSALTDEEYLMGIINFNQNLARYAIGRATDRDVTSVKVARDLVSSILDYLMKFDFRNGNLRRRYDGVKYSLKTCETVLYELSVTGCDVTVPTPLTNDADGHSAKRARIDDPDATTHPASSSASASSSPSTKVDTAPIPTLLPEEQLESLRQRMAHRDELRESLIKKCRDGQKAAKQAIYALHRDDYKKASRLIEDCEKCVLEQLMPIVDEEPSLRYGAFANVLEEYAEAQLFYAWLKGHASGSGSDDDVQMADAATPPATVLLRSDFTKFSLEAEEYLGGLCDLTGEVGRYAVKRGTLRDTDSVKCCLETSMSVLYSLESLHRLPGNIGKKMDPLRRSVEKLEKMLYELSLVEATGRNSIVAGLNDVQVDVN